MKKMVVRDTETVNAFVNSMTEGIMYFSKGRIPAQKIWNMAEIEVSKLDFSNDRVCNAPTLKALQRILNFEKRLPDDFDSDKELWEARIEKYGRAEQNDVVKGSD